jgi:hypothetical protein
MLRHPGVYHQGLLTRLMHRPPVSRCAAVPCDFWAALADAAEKRARVPAAHDGDLPRRVIAVRGRVRLLNAAFPADSEHVAALPLHGFGDRSVKGQRGTISLLYAAALWGHR